VNGNAIPLSEIAIRAEKDPYPMTAVESSAQHAHPEGKTDCVSGDNDLQHVLLKKLQSSWESYFLTWPNLIGFCLTLALGATRLLVAAMRHEWGRARVFERSLTILACSFLNGFLFTLYFAHSSELKPVAARRVLPSLILGVFWIAFLVLFIVHVQSDTPALVLETIVEHAQLALIFAAITGLLFAVPVVALFRRFMKTNEDVRESLRAPVEPPANLRKSDADAWLAEAGKAESEEE
jgi:hypothetical protein